MVSAPVELVGPANPRSDYAPKDLATELRGDGDSPHPDRLLHKQIVELVRYYRSARGPRSWLPFNARQVISRGVDQIEAEWHQVDVCVIDAAADLAARRARPMLEGADVPVDRIQTSADVQLERRKLLVEVRCQCTHGDEVLSGHQQQPAFDERAERRQGDEVGRLEQRTVPCLSRRCDA